MRPRSILLAFALVACTRAPAPPPRALAIEVGGCAAFTEADGCALGSRRTVRVRLHDADAQPTFGDATATRVESRDAGALYDVVLPEGATTLHVRATLRDGPAEATAKVYVATSYPRIRDVEQRRAAGDLDGAEALAREAAGGADLHERNLAEGALARIALRRGRTDEAARRLGSSAETALAHGWLSEAADDTFARVFVLHQRARRYSEARAALDALSARLGPYADGRERLPLYRGQLLLETGDLRGALRDFRDAADGAARFAHPRDGRAARQLLAQALAKTGRTDEALALVGAVQDELARAADATPCERVEVAMAAAYVALRGADDGRPLGRDTAPRPTPGCADVYLDALGHLHTARVSARRGDAETARAELSLFRAATREPRLTDTLEALDVDGRVATLVGDPRAALDAYRAMHDVAERAHRLEHGWRGAVGMAAALLALRRRPEALAAYRQAEDTLDEARDALDLGDGDADFLRSATESARGLAEALVADGKPAEAERVARRARARGLARVAALAEERGRSPAAERALERVRAMRDLLDEEVGRDWRRSAAERTSVEAERRETLERAVRDLAAAARLVPSRLPETTTRSDEPGTLDLTVLGGKGASVLVLASAGGHATAHHVADLALPEPELARALLGPIEPALLAAKRVRVMLARGMDGLDVHALPFHGAPLVKALEVVYAEDLGAPRPSGSGPPLVVANPSDDLPRAREEGEAVARALADGPRGEPRLVLGREATAARARAALEDTSLFHYAGHARFAGPLGLASDLPLAAGTALTFADVLALRRVPAEVVLSGCEAGRGELGLARAWIVAGSSVVVAPSRPVADAEGLAFATSLYRHAKSTGLVSAARMATLDSIYRGSEEWRAFRTFVR